MNYLFFDIDGTLLSHEEGIPLSAIEAIKLTKEKGNKVFICTGRSLAEVPKGLYDFGFDGVIAAAGGYVKLGDEVLFNKIIPDEMVDNIVKEIVKTDIPYVLEGVEEAYSHKEALAMSLVRDEKQRKIKEKTKYEHSAYDYRIIRTNSISDYYNNRTPISKITLLGNSPEDYKEIEKFIEDDFYLIKYERYAELVANGINKFTGIEVVLDYLGAKVENTFAFGDSLNDYDMIKECNTGIAMGNASAPVKEIADYITDTVENDGIYKALKHFELI